MGDRGPIAKPHGRYLDSHDRPSDSGLVRQSVAPVVGDVAVLEQLDREIENWLGGLRWVDLPQWDFVERPPSKPIEWIQRMDLLLEPQRHHPVVSRHVGRLIYMKLCSSPLNT